jgi:hypothetical protein
MKECEWIEDIGSGSASVSASAFDSEQEWDNLSQGSELSYEFGWDSFEYVPVVTNPFQLYDQYGQ